MSCKEFDVEDISELVGWGKGEPMDGFELVHEELFDTTRWSVQYEIVFKAPDGKYYTTIYERGATEMQDYNYWDDWDPCCMEVKPVEVVTTKWVSVS